MNLPRIATALLCHAGRMAVGAAACLRGRDLGPRNRLEAAALVCGLAGLALGLGLGGAQALFEPGAPTQDELRRAVLASGLGHMPCPDGWAQDHAAYLDLSEAQVSAWYVGESMRASDAEIRRDAAAFYARPDDFRWGGQTAVTETQIVLCIAESRRMI